LTEENLKGLEMMTKELLRIKGLKTYFHTHLGVAKAVDDLDLEVNQGDILGIVGESGCGKSVTALSIMRLIKCPPGKMEAGSAESAGLRNEEDQRE
jgi:ABC-type dipeptide/oligopeptide/nickel transport system ATPase component